MPSAADSAARPSAPGSGGQLLRFGARTVDWLRERLFQLWAAAVIAGFLLVLGAHYIGIDSVRFDGSIAGGTTIPFDRVDGQRPVVQGKEVGFASAPNWSLYAIVIAPFMLVAIVRVWSDMRRAIHDAARQGLVRDADFSPIPVAEVERAWRTALRRCGFVFVAIVVAALGSVLHDWWQVVYSPIRDPDLLAGVRLSDRNLEFDWSVACLFPKAAVNCGTNLAFGAVVYGYIAAALTALAFATCVAAALFAYFVCGSGSLRGREWRLAAVPCSPDDDRGGFGLFAPFFSALFVLAILVVIGCILMMMQNAYLRDPHSGTIVAFLFEDASQISRATQEKRSVPEWLGLGWAVGWFFQPSRVVWANLQSAIGVPLFALVATITVGASWSLLRHSAVAARDWSLNHVPRIANECGISQDLARHRLQYMRIWPIGWMGQVTLLVVLGFLLVSVFYYRLILVPVAFLTAMGVSLLVQPLLQAIGNALTAERTPPPPPA